MTQEGKRTNSEQSTESHEDSFNMVNIPLSNDVNNNSARTITKEINFKVRGTPTRSYDNGLSNVKNFAFLPRNSNTRNTYGLLDSVKVGQKRQLRFLGPESQWENSRSRLALEYHNEKRFKSDETKESNGHKHLLDESNHEPSYFRENSVYHNPSFKKNVSHAPRKLDFNLNGLSNMTPKHLFGFDDQKARVDQQETLISHPQTFADLRNIFRTSVDETKCDYGKEDLSEAENTNKEGNRKYEENFPSNSEKFISLDSTKSSFLTMIKKMRHTTECGELPCPFCIKTFSKYADLRLHVQTKKCGANPSMEKTKQDEQRLQKNQLSHRYSQVTPITSHAVHNLHQPNRRLSTGDGMKRASTVIQFAERKVTKESMKK